MEINKQYGILYKKLKTGDISDALKLENAQKGWIQYRNNHCELMGSIVGSPMYHVCPMDLNIIRAKELGDLSKN